MGAAQHAGMDTYGGVALGVECAWPAPHNSHKDKGANKMRSRILSAVGIALALAGVAVLAGRSNKEGSHR
ncbi:MAG TPA: hypothetical protein VET51_05150 [Burkholderiales bacterium]|nr:hypothetical protein [Burkholderiales bacterium]